MSTDNNSDIFSKLGQKMYERWALNLPDQVEWSELSEQTQYAWKDLACFAIHNEFTELRYNPEQDQ